MGYENLRLEINQNMNPLYTVYLKKDGDSIELPLYQGNYREDLIQTLDRYVARKMREQYNTNTKMFKDIDKILKEIEEAGK